MWLVVIRFHSWQAFGQNDVSRNELANNWTVPVLASSNSSIFCTQKCLYLYLGI